jgi:hypothetical protein
MTKRPSLVVVGGFLGAGKTTLILAAARELASRGLKSAIILNDQGDALVDTQLARHGGFDAEEVTGGCFCCNFSSMLEAAERLRTHAPDVIFAEPVGSCTDISVTVLRPLRESYQQEYRLAPFTVCVDPMRAREMEKQDAGVHLVYLFENQLAEADLVCYTKSDLHPAAPAAPNVRYVSGQTGQGVAAWLDEVLFGQIASGSHALDIDYEEYARAEAALAWLNLRAIVECDPPISSAMLLVPLLDRIAGSLEIVHLKATVQSDAGFLKAAMCGSQEDPNIEGALDASPAEVHEILINLRATGSPEPVRTVVEESMAELNGRIVDQQIACFTPAPPKRPAGDERPSRRGPRPVTSIG